MDKDTIEKILDIIAHEEKKCKRVIVHYENNLVMVANDIINTKKVNDYMIGIYNAKLETLQTIRKDILNQALQIELAKERMAE